MKIIVLLARICFSAIFIFSGLSHFSQRMIDFGASYGIPYASFAVPFAGLLALFGGVSVLIGLYPKIGAWMLVAFLVPVTLTMHRFWERNDAGQAMLEQIMFMKNLSMLGGALLITYFGSGPLSLSGVESEPLLESATRHRKDIDKSYGRNDKKSVA